MASPRKIFSSELDYIVDAVIRPNFGNYSISIGQITTTSFSKGFDHKNGFGLVLILVQVH